jgi:hypothetical protein
VVDIIEFHAWVEGRDTNSMEKLFKRNWFSTIKPSSATMNILTN